MDLVLREPLHLLLAYQERQNLKLSMQWLDPIPAPIKMGDKIGTLTVDISDKSLTELTLYAGQDVLALGMFDRISAAIKYLIFGAAISELVAK